jgi:hypothetical protein
VYPWDYSFIPANNPNWEPRPVIHSYAAYTHWLDEQNSTHFKSGKAPRFVIWELEKETPDLNGGNLESVDNRYLLNDEPQTIHTLLSNYQLHTKSNKLLLFEKNTTKQLAVPQIIGRANATWDQWIDVPAVKDGLLRAKIKLYKNIAGKLKSTFYKDEETYVYLLLTTNEIILYKIIPRNAADGIWINPLVLHPENEYAEPLVKKILLKNSNKKHMAGSIEIEWEHTEIFATNKVVTPSADNNIVDTFKKAYQLFHKHKPMPLTDNKIFKNNISDFTSVQGWTFEKEAITKSDFYSPPFSNLILPYKFSTTFSFIIDSTGIKNLAAVIGKVWIKSLKTTQAQLVISVEYNQQPVLWQGLPIKNFIIDERGWNYAYLKVPINTTEIKAGSKLSFYIWNNDASKIMADDFEVNIITNK